MKELNLIPYNIRQKKEKELRLRNNTAIGIIALCILFLCVYIPKLSLAKLYGKANELQQQVNANSKVLEDNKKLTSEINDINTYINNIDSITKKRILASERIRDLQQYTPKEVVVKSITYTKNSININGTSSVYNPIAEFAANLQNSKKMSKVNIVSITYGAGINQGYSFEIDLSY